MRQTDTEADRYSTVYERTDVIYRIRAKTMVNCYKTFSIRYTYNVLEHSVTSYNVT